MNAKDELMTIRDIAKLINRMSISESDKHTLFDVVEYFNATLKEQGARIEKLETESFPQPEIDFASDGGINIDLSKPDQPQPAKDIVDIDKLVDLLRNSNTDVQSFVKGYVEAAHAAEGEAGDE